METAQASDKGLGFGVLFGALGVLSALVMLMSSLGENQLLAGWAFAAAMLTGTLAVAAVHLYQ